MRINRPVEEALREIQALDLDPIKFKLMDPDEGQGWSREYADAMEVAYRRFLTLLVKHADTPIAPTKDIDRFWHAHILDTMKYAEDCERMFGTFLHHFPYFGMRGEDDAKALAAAGDAMARLYREEFGEELPKSRGAAARPAYCYVAAPAKDAAYCYAAAKQDAAYCYAAVRTGKDSAYCYAPSVDVTTRPALETA